MTSLNNLYNFCYLIVYSQGLPALLTKHTLATDKLNILFNIIGKTTIEILLIRTTMFLSLFICKPTLMFNKHTIRT